MNIAGQKPGGTHGCEIWLSLKLPFASVSGRKKFISREMVSVVFSSYRCIIVRVSSKYINFLAISAHAPYAGCKTDDPAACSRISPKLAFPCANRSRPAPYYVASVAMCRVTGRAVS